MHSSESSRLLEDYVSNLPCRVYFSSACRGDGDFMQITLVANENGDDFFTFPLLSAIHPLHTGHVYWAHALLWARGLGLGIQK